MTGHRHAQALLLVLALPALGAAVPPATMRVPPSLQKDNEQIQASGIVWAPPLDRYLVVSDMTGRSGRRHPAWVFAMSREGVFDPAPIPIRGLEEMYDAEAICAGPDGSYYLATSHSRDTQGLAKPERRMLLRLKLVGRELVPQGRIDLTTLRDAEGRNLLAVAGLAPNAEPHVEGIAMAGEALLVGLRAPLTPAGEAVIVRIDRPAEAFRSGRVPRASMTLHRAVNLPVPARGKSVRRGISDVLSLPDGSLIVLANAPDKSPSDGGGAMYWLRPDAAKPKLVREFPGLRPEGAAIGEDGRTLMVVFDSGKELSRWTSVPLPR